ncbi:hypothetical protein [Nocardia sp. NPDC003963]
MPGSSLAPDDAKADLARRQGADIVLTSTPETLRDDLLAATGVAGADVFLETPPCSTSADRPSSAVPERCSWHGGTMTEDCRPRCRRRP